MFGDQMVDLSKHFLEMPCGCERALRLMQDPMAAADFFEFSFRSLFHHLLGWDFEAGRSTEARGILGFIRSFYGTSEFTECGSLHGHFLIWLEGGLNPSELHDCLCNSPEYQQRFFTYFKDIIHHHLPDTDNAIKPDFEPRVQHPPCPPEVHAPSDVMQEWDAICATEIKQCGEVLQRHHCWPVCHKYGNADHCHFLFLHEIVDASSFDSESNSVVLMCHNANIHYFNLYILVFCRHNHDIKCILSGRGARAAMFYISEYITTMDMKTYEVLSLLSRAVTPIPTCGQDVSPAESAKVLLHKCLSQFNGQHQVHAQQVVRYIQGFGDGIPSHETAPMLSSLLIGYVKDQYPWLKSGCGLYQM
jgi:hypothetical protein